MLEIKQPLLDEMIKEATKNYPQEACGILLGEKNKKSATEFVPCKNIYDEMRQKDSKTYPRSSKTAYLIDAKDQKRIFDDTEKRGLIVKAMFHSHTDHDAYFSDEDKYIAAPWGEPMFPNISYIVVSIWDKKFKEANEFYWDEKKKTFVCSKL